MTFAHLSDTHLGYRSYRKLTPEGYNQREEDVREAFVKAIGDGLYHALDTFEVSFLPGKPAMLLGMEGCPMATSQWFIQELNPTSGCAAAFAVKGQDWRLCHYQYPHLLIGEK